MQFPIIDLHCDTISECLENNVPLKENHLHLDLRRMQNYPHYTQFFACFSDPVYAGNAKKHCLEVIDRLHTEIAKNSREIALCKSYSDWTMCKEQGKTAAFLSIEGGEMIESLADLRILYQLGVRCIALTWNQSNHLAGGVLEPDPRKGLTEFGETVLLEMMHLGIFLDVSHLSDASFWDAAELWKGPILATHSNARKICNHPRNLENAQFLQIKKSGGCVGINLYPLFLNSTRNAGVCDVVRHIEHFLTLGGEDTVAIGADFDGVDCLPAGILGVQDMDCLFEELARLGYSDTLLEKIAYKNFERVLAFC